MELYIVTENDDIGAIVDGFEKAKVLCEQLGYTRVIKFKLNQLSPLKQWIYDEYYKKWEEFNCD